MAATASAAARASVAPRASASVNVASPVSRARSPNVPGSSVARRATIMARRRAWSGPAAKRETVARSHVRVPTGPAGGGGGTVYAGSSRTFTRPRYGRDASLWRELLLNRQVRRRGRLGLGLLRARPRRRLHVTAAVALARLVHPALPHRVRDGRLVRVIDDPVLQGHAIGARGHGSAVLAQAVGELLAAAVVGLAHLDAAGLDHGRVLRSEPLLELIGRGRRV